MPDPTRYPPMSRETIRSLDRRAVEEFGLPSIVLMENASRGLAEVLAAELPSLATPVLIVAGAGNNAGDGFAVARHLHNRGFAAVRVALAVPRNRVTGDAAVNLAVIERMGLPILRLAEPSEQAELDADTLDRELAAARADDGVVLDALLGTGLARPVEGPLRTAIERINASAARVVAVDIPSGLDADTGRPLGVAVRASRTLTLVAPKLGFAADGAAAFTGPVTVVRDIGLPRELLAQERPTQE